MKNILILFYCWFVITVLICSVSPAETFTIAVLPDTQNYVRDTYVQPASSYIFRDEAQFIVDNINAMNIVFVSHVGDVVNNGASYYSQWTRARDAMNILKNSGIPMGMAAGNHDYDILSVPIHNSTYWNYFFGPTTSYFYGKSWYGGACINASDTSGMSSWQTFKAGSQDFLHIILEVEPSDDVIAWAQGVIDAHEGWPTIINTHKYMSYSGGYYSTVSYRTGYPANTTYQLWDKFIALNPQIFMVLCGHSFSGEAYCSYRRVDQTDSGTNVYQMMSDYQGVKSSLDGSLGLGGGWTRLMEFDTELKTIRVRTYSVILDKYSDDPTLTDSSTYAKTWAPFNYVGGTGSLRTESDPRSSHFTLPLEITTYGPHIEDLVKAFKVSGSGDWVIAGLAFDPTVQVGGKYDRIYYCNRVATGNQGIYAASISGGTSSGRLALGGVVDSAGPYGCTTDQNGTVYVCYNNAAQVWKVTNPSGTPGETQLIGTYSGSDDDIQSISMVPTGFGGGFDPGIDIVVYDGGIGNNNYEGVTAIQSNSTVSNPLYSIIWQDNSGYFPGDQRGCASNIDGYYYLAGMTIPKASLGGTQTCYINRVKADGIMQRIFLDTDITQAGAKPSLDDALTVNPHDGSVWLVTANTSSDANPRIIWRVDVANAAALGGNDYYAVTTAEIIDFYQNIGVNSLAWSPDGKYLAVGTPSGDDAIYIFNNGLPPVDCNDAIEKGYALEYDLNSDCEVNFKDFAIFAESWADFIEVAGFTELWLECIDPDNPRCSRPWME